MRFSKCSIVDGQYADLFIDLIATSSKENSNSRLNNMSGTAGFYFHLHLQRLSFYDDKS